MIDSSSNLNEILKLSQVNAAQNKRTLAVFDLDSTLFNVSTRTQKILEQFAELHQLDELKKIEILHTDWGIKEAVLRQGYNLEEHADLLNELRDFWHQRFFSNEYLQYDVPYAGAIEFVLEMAATGAQIFYLTGRDQVRMGQGSKDVLLKWGFPCEGEQLILKPVKTMNDELFKRDWFLRFDRKLFDKIYFFENEPVIINAVLEHVPDVEVIFLDTTHARQQTVTAPIRKISHFKRS